MLNSILQTPFFAFLILNRNIKKSQKSSRSEHEHNSSSTDHKHQGNAKNKFTVQSYPKPWKSEGKIVVRSTDTSYLDDTFTGSEKARKEGQDALGQSCDSLRSVESLKLDSIKEKKVYSSRHRNSSISQSNDHPSRHENRSRPSESKNGTSKSGKDKKRGSKNRSDKVTKANKAFKHRWRFCTIIIVWEFSYCL